VFACSPSAGTRIRSADPGLLGYLLGSEIAQRVASDQFDRNAGLAGLARAYLPVIVAGALPWWPWAAHRAWRLRDSTAPWRRRLGEPSRLLLLLWIALPLAVFCASTSRLPLYLLQLTPAASLAMARTLAAGPFRRRAQAALAAWVLALVGVKAYATVHATDRDGRAFARSVVALYPQPLRELAFVEHRPHYAASFYLRCEMEELGLDGTPRLEPVSATELLSQAAGGPRTAALLRAAQPQASLATRADSPIDRRSWATSTSSRSTPNRVAPTQTSLNVGTHHQELHHAARTLHPGSVLLSVGGDRWVRRPAHRDDRLQAGRHDAAGLPCL
jgi:hypothetical protein